MIIKGPGGFGSWLTSGDHPNNSIPRRLPEYREVSWRLEETCCHLNSSERPSAKTDVKNSNE